MDKKKKKEMAEEVADLQAVNKTMRGSAGGEPPSHAAAVRTAEVLARDPGFTSKSRPPRTRKYDHR